MPEARLAIRDLVLAIIAAVLWLNAGDSTLLQWAAGIGLGVVAYVAHEWSHWLGAKLSGAQVKIAQRLATPFLFSFDADANTRGQFLWMSIGGFIATAIFVVAFWLGLPDTLQGEVAMGAVLVLASITLFIEVPIALWVSTGRPIPKLIELF